MNYFVTGIDTNIGKTVCSAILMSALTGKYWKPIQCGDLHNSDTMNVAKLTGSKKEDVFPSAFEFKTAASPHYAAKIENIQIGLDDFTTPVTDMPLVIEGAGGALVPINEDEVIIDLANKFNSKVIVVSKNYLGSINHTLLTIEALRARGLDITGIIFNGEKTISSEDIILKKSSIPKLLHINNEPSINQNVIDQYALILRKRFYELAI